MRSLRQAKLLILVTMICFVVSGASISKRSTWVNLKSMLDNQNLAKAAPGILMADFYGRKRDAHASFDQTAAAVPNESSESLDSIYLEYSKKRQIPSDLDSFKKLMNAMG